MKLQTFLDKYDTVIFDMDGVITSEENYWNCAALTVWEYLNRCRSVNIDAPECMERLADIRGKVFFDDKLISILKNKGVNSNWDLGYVTVCAVWICRGVENWDGFDGVLDYISALPDNIIDAYDAIAAECSEKTGYDYGWLRRGGLMWETMRLTFQSWFLGDGLFFEQYGAKPLNGGKSGLLFREEPIIPKDKLTELLRLLSRDKRVCTGTGRPYIEMLRPIEAWGVKRYFAPDGLCNYDHVAAAQKNLGCNKLTKPHPYMFLKALYGTDYEDKRLVEGDYDTEKIKKTLIVGDAGADILAAKAMGADFCAVLTGIRGEDARGYFEDMGAEYILKNVTDMLI